MEKESRRCDFATEVRTKHDCLCSTRHLIYIQHKSAPQRR